MAEINKDLVKIDYLQGMKYKDLATKFDVSIDTVKSWVKRGGWAKEKEKIVPQVAPKKEKVSKKECTQKEKGAHKNIKQIVSEKIGEDCEPVPYIENKNLNDRQKLFCIYYIKCFNATKAAIKAGYSKDSAYSIGSENLTKPEIKAEIQRLKADKLKGAFLSKEDLLQKYIDIALSDITDYMEFGQKEYIVKNEETGEEETRTYNYVDFKNSNEVDGTLISEVKQGKDGVSIKLIDKKTALDFLAKYSGLLDIPTQQKLDIERRKMELLEKQADDLDQDIEYSIEGEDIENTEED